MVPDAAGSAAWGNYLEGLGSHESGCDDVFYSFNDFDWEGIPPPEDTQSCLPSEPVGPPHAQHQPAKSKQRVKLEKLRARNRLAQARYRQKAKVCQLPINSVRYCTLFCKQRTAGYDRCNSATA